MRLKHLCPYWEINYPSANPDSCVLLLPGRAQDGEFMASQYRHMNLGRTMLVGVTPEFHEWYPMPNGANDQKEAVEGQLKAGRAILRVVREIGDLFSIPPSKIALVGFSAGAVMALYAAALSKDPFAAAVVHAGAILDTGKFPTTNRTTPVLLIHSRDDYTFDWNERYLPMLSYLESNWTGPVSRIERPMGDHDIYADDIMWTGDYLFRQLGYEGNYEELWGRPIAAYPSDKYLVFDY